MLCDECGKREASVHWTQIIDNKKVVLNLCRQCAEKKGIHSPFEGAAFPLADLLGSMLDKGGIKKATKGYELKCLACGITFSDFSKAGRLGCGTCYKTFRKPLSDLLRKIHGSNQHRGRIPATPGDVMKPLREERRLQEELKKAVDEEDFEKAAKLRDQIKTLSKK